MNENRDLEGQWREWSRSKSNIDERQLRRNLLDRIPEPRTSRATRLVLVAAAASLVALLIGYESSRPVLTPNPESHAVVYETGPNVILVLREGAEPIYVLTEPSDRDPGE